MTDTATVLNAHDATTARDTLAAQQTVLLREQFLISAAYTTSQANPEYKRLMKAMTRVSANRRALDEAEYALWLAINDESVENQESSAS